MHLALSPLCQRTLVVVAAITCCVASSGWAADDNSADPSSPMPLVSGFVQFGAQKSEMTQLYFRRKETDDGPVLALLFSDQPLTARLLDDRQKLTDHARQGGFLGLSVELDLSGSVGQSDLLHLDGAFSGPWGFEPLPDRGESRTAGRIGVDEEREFFGTIYNVDVKFDLGTGIIFDVESLAETMAAVEAKEAWRGSPFRVVNPTGLALGGADGWVTCHGVRTLLTSALVVVEADLFGDSGARQIFLSASPLTEEMLQAPYGPQPALREAGVFYLRVDLDAQGEIQSLNLPSEDGQPFSFSSTQWNIELARMPAGELDGRVHLAGADDDDPSYPRFDVRFHAPTRTVGAASPVSAADGRPLPKDGGAPGLAYRDYVKVLKKAKTIAELLPLRIARARAMLEAVPSDQHAAMLEFFKEQARQPFKIVGGFANEQQATLWLEGKQGGERVEGRVNVHREDGAWKLGQEAFRNVSPSPAAEN